MDYETMALSKDESPVAVKPTQRILLVDDDVIFGRMMEKGAYYQGLDLTYCSSVWEMMKVGHLDSFDVVLVDYHLGNVKGSLVAEFSHLFFGRVPVIIVSSSSEWWLKSKDRYPGSLRGFIQKEAPISDILSDARAAADSHRASLASGEYQDQCAQPYPNWRRFYNAYRSVMAFCGNALMSSISLISWRRPLTGEKYSE